MKEEYLWLDYQIKGEGFINLPPSNINLFAKMEDNQIILDLICEESIRWYFSMN